MTTTLIRNGDAVITHPVTNAWTDLMVTIPGAVNVDGLIRNLTQNPVVVVKGGANAPSGSTGGEVIPPFGSTYCNSDHAWVRSNSTLTGTLAFETL